MPQSSKIIFFGNERLSTGFEPDGAPTLQALIDNGYQVAAVVAHFEPGQSRKARGLEIQEVAGRNNVPVLLPDKVNDIADDLRASKADIGVLVAFGKIIPEHIIKIFPKGIINIHPSLLPQYRGPTPIEQAIIDGIAKTGVSLMGLIKTMDAGPIFAQDEIELTGRETKQELTTKLLASGAHLLIKTLPAILNGSAKPWPQNESAATYTQLLKKNDDQMNLLKTAIQLEREVRAFATWPKSRLIIENHPVVVLEARVLPGGAQGALIVACGDGTFLEITKLIAPSGRTMSGAEFLRGYARNV